MGGRIVDATCCCGGPGPSCTCCSGTVPATITGTLHDFSSDCGFDCCDLTPLNDVEFACAFLSSSDEVCYWESDPVLVEDLGCDPGDCSPGGFYDCYFKLKITVNCEEDGYVIVTADLYSSPTGAAPWTLEYSWTKTFVGDTIDCADIGTIPGDIDDWPYPCLTEPPYIVLS